MRQLRLIGILCLIAVGDVDDGRADDNVHGHVQAAVGRGLNVLERGARAYPANQTCFACHHQTLPLLAMTAAHEASLPIDKELIQEQEKFTRNSFEQRQKRLSQGEHIGGRAATVSYGLWTFALAKCPPDELTSAMTSYLLTTQQADGSWKPPSNRPPLESSAVSCTVLSAVGVKRFAPPDLQGPGASAVEKARIWLLTAPLAEQDDLNFALWGQVLLGGTDERREHLRDRILAARNADGGWSQNPTLHSDAYATGQTLFVLAECGLSPDEAAFREGVAFLLETQQADGSWHVVTRSKPIQPWFDNGDPHDKDQFISVAATGWATAALARSLRK